MKVSCVWSLDRFSSSGFVYEGSLFIKAVCVIFQVLYMKTDSVVQVLYMKAVCEDKFSSSGFVYEGKLCVIFRQIQ